MPKNRIIPAIGIALVVPLWAWAQGGPSAPIPTTAAATKEAAPEPPTEAENTIDEAIKKVTSLEAVSADLTETVQMLGEKFEIKGRYLRAPKRRVYLRLEVVGLTDTAGKMLQVCDGDVLWDFQQVFDTKIYRKFKIGEIVAKLKSPELDDSFRTDVISQLGLAGPDVLLAGLRKAIKFDQKESDTLDGKPVWVLRGNWKDRTGLLGPNQQPLPSIAPLPSYVPSLATVIVGKEDGWPYKVLLVGQPPRTMMMEDTRPIGPDGRRQGPRSLIQKPLLSRVELVYSNVKLNQTIEDKEFVFTVPPDARVEDNTQSILNGLEQAVQVKAAQKKAEEASKGDNDLLDQSISIPKAAPAPLPPSEPGSPTPK